MDSVISRPWIFLVEHSYTGSSSVYKFPHATLRMLLQSVEVPLTAQPTIEFCLRQAAEIRYRVRHGAQFK